MKLQVPFSKKQPRRRVSRSQLASQTRDLTAPPSGGKQIQAGASFQAEEQPNSGRPVQSATSTLHGNSRSDDQGVNKDTPTIDKDIDMLPSSADTATTDHLRDAGYGKARVSSRRIRPKTQKPPASQIPNHSMDTPMPSDGRGDGKLLPGSGWRKSYARFRAHNS
jgi:hypothetical protein